MGEGAKVFSPDALTGQTGQESHEPGFQVRMLLPGVTLRNDRYQLREQLNRQDWQKGAYEAIWLAQDAQRGGSQVIISEVAIPDSSSMVAQSMLRTATIALTSMGRHPHIPTLWDAFGEQERNFFVFEPVEGESLSARMRRTGRALSEQEVVECCFQIAEILEVLSQQMPPLVHGLIRPEHIVIGRNDQYSLTSFSILMVGGAFQFVAGLDYALHSPYMSPEFAQGVADTRADLYSLLATAYHVVTGSMPAFDGGAGTIPSAQRLNPMISPQFDQLLSRGLSPIMGQRYQRASELKYDLLGIRTMYGSPVARNPFAASEMSFAQLVQMQSGPLQPMSSSATVDTVAQVLPTMLSSELVNETQDQRLLLPLPEELPPMAERNDQVRSILWFAGILVCLIVIVVLSRILS
jgi:serine/threonine protein kinase